MRISIGIDAAKEVHWATAVTRDGHVLLDRKVFNTAEDIGELGASLAALGGERLIGIEPLGCIATLVGAMLPAAGERLVHVPGLAVNRACWGGVGGRAESDPKARASSLTSSACAWRTFGPSRSRTRPSPNCACSSAAAAIWSQTGRGASATCVICSTVSTPTWSARST